MIFSSAGHYCQNQTKNRYNNNTDNTDNNNNIILQNENLIT